MILIIMIKPSSPFSSQQGGTTHVVWSWGAGPLYRLGGVLAAGDQTGLVRVQLLKPNLPQPDHHKGDCKVLQVSHDLSIYLFASLSVYLPIHLSLSQIISQS